MPEQTDAEAAYRELEEAIHTMTNVGQPGWKPPEGGWAGLGHKLHAASEILWTADDVRKERDDLEEERDKLQEKVEPMEEVVDKVKEILEVGDDEDVDLDDLDDLASKAEAYDRVADDWSLEADPFRAWYRQEIAA